MYTQNSLLSMYVRNDFVVITLPFPCSKAFFVIRKLVVLFEKCNALCLNQITYYASLKLHLHDTASKTLKENNRVVLKPTSSLWHC